MDIQPLSQAGLKVTGPRLKILKVLEEQSSATRHLSAEDIYKQLLHMGEDIGLATIYRVLTQFKAAGLVTQQNFSGDYAVFELNHGTHHHHLVCIQCGKVNEFTDEIIDQQQQSIAQQHEFKTTEYNVIIYGVCAACAISERNIQGLK